MATCKDCIHYYACVDRLGTTKFYDNVIAANNVEDLCKTFKDKSLVLDLPCKVGDTVYRQRKKGQSLKRYDNVSLEWIVAHIQEFGVRIFLTLNDYHKSAEQALKESGK